jgi:hypothetical protein
MNLVCSTSTEIPHDAASVEQYWKQRKYLRKNMWLEMWLRQEIQALTQVQCYVLAAQLFYSRYLHFHISVPGVSQPSLFQKKCI